MQDPGCRATFAKRPDADAKNHMTMETPMKKPFACRRITWWCMSLLMLATAPTVQAWTDKPVRMVVPAPAGGTMDVVARLLAEQLSADLKVNVVVDNKPGAGGAIAVQNLISAGADGQTIMVTASNVLTEIPLVMKTSFDPLKDVKPIAAIARAGMVLVGTPALPASFKDMVAELKSQPGKLSYASYTAGTASHYAGAIFNQKAGLDLAHVPFAGSPPALQQVMSGQIAIMFDGIVTSTQLIKGGKLRGYAVAARQRSPLLPDLPTTVELGLPDIDFSNWLGVVAASGVSNDLAERINQAVAKAAAAPALRSKLQAVGFETPAPENAAEMSRSMRAEIERNASIVKTYNIQLNQ